MIRQPGTRWQAYRHRAWASLPIDADVKQVDAVAIKLARQDYRQAIAPLISIKIRLAYTEPTVYVLHPDGRLEAHARPQYGVMLDEIDRQIAEIAKQFQF